MGKHRLIRQSRSMDRRTVLAAGGALGGSLAAMLFSFTQGISQASSRNQVGAPSGLDPMPPLDTMPTAPAPAPGTDWRQAGPPETVIDEVHSYFRGRTVELLTVRPAGELPRTTPVCLVLHGRNGNARHPGFTTLPQALGDAIAAGAVPPYAFALVDGGNSYWHEHEPGDDPMGMLLEEVPRWLARRGLGGPSGQPAAVAGVSMGGFGALLYARRRNERRRPVRACATLAPALITTWEEMKLRNAFHDEADWASMDPLRHIDKLGTVPNGIWCGTEDPFIEGARLFTAAAKPEISSLTPGGHSLEYFNASLPAMVRFLGRHLD